jgi:hypothetical protein
MKRLMRWFKREMRDMDMCFQYDTPFHKPARIRVFMAVLVETLRWNVYLRSRCWVRGHEWRSLDYATPEEGGTGAECRHCGHSHFTQLY